MKKTRTARNKPEKRRMRRKSEQDPLCVAPGWEPIVRGLDMLTSCDVSYVHEAAQLSRDTSNTEMEVWASSTKALLSVLERTFKLHQIIERSSASTSSTRTGEMARAWIAAQCSTMSTP